MVKNHLKRLTIPNTWKGVMKKAQVFIHKPSPGPHGIQLCMTICEIIKQLGMAKTSKEVKYILHNKTVLVDQRRIKNLRFPIGLLDTISFSDIKEEYRMTLDNKGKLDIRQIEKNSNKKICRVNQKRVISKGKIQLNLFGGRSLLTEDNKIKRADSIVIELPSQKITGHLPLQKDAKIVLIGGKHKGDFGTVTEMKDNAITYKNKENKEIQTLKKYAYVVTPELI